MDSGLDRTVPINEMNTRVGGWDGAPTITDIMDF